MSKKIAIAILLLAIAAACLGTGQARASELYRQNSEVNSMMTKLGRGATNFLTGWMEIPKQIGQSVRETDPVTGTILGVCRGAGWAVARTASGVFEVVTFPFPVPKDYEPLIIPEYIMMDMWGEPFPIISDPDNNDFGPNIRY